MLRDESCRATAWAESLHGSLDEPSRSGERRLSDRSRIVRLQNARIAAAARRHHFAPGEHVAFLCECDDGGCGEFVSLPLAPYDALRDERLYIVARGHTVASCRRVPSADGYDTFRSTA